MSVQTAQASERFSEFSLMFPIVGSHFRRIGLLRTLVGGLSMYLTIPVFILCHLTTAVFLYQWILRPLLGIPRVRWADHVILDRHRIEPLPYIDRFNCLFCGYANGLLTMLNMEIDHVANADTSLPAWRGALAAAVSILFIPVVLIVDLFTIEIVYNVLISRPLGMHRTTRREATAILEEHSYASGWSRALRSWIRAAKNPALRFSLALEQIESSWCPLSHFEKREGIVYPDHHGKFFGPDEIDAMRETLSTVGTVSPRKPTW